LWGSTINPRLRSVALLLAAAGCAGSPYAHDARDWHDTEGGSGIVLGSSDLGRAIEFSPVPVDSGWLVGVTNRRVMLLSADGAVTRWTRKLTGPPAGMALVVGDLVVQGADAPGLAVYGLSLADGSVRWKHDSPAAQVVQGAGAVFSVDLRGSVARLDTASGEPVWETDVSGAGWIPPAFCSGPGLLLVPARPDTLVALDAASGDIAWSRQVGSWPRVTAADTTAYLLSEDGVLAAILGATGEPLVSRDLGGIPAGPAVAWGDRIAVALTDGRVLQLDAGTLDTRCESRLEPPLVAAPAVGDGVLAQPAPQGWIVLLDRGGAERGRFRHPERLSTAPVFADGRLAVGGGGGTFIVYRSGS